MSDLLVTKTTALQPDDVITHAEQFFASEHWLEVSRNGYAATFVGRPRLPWHQMVLVVLFSLCMVVPGVVYYSVSIRKQRRIQSIAVTAKLRGDRSEVLVQYPPGTERLMTGFLADLV
ncbi:MAG TPA: hypothetical protein VF730_05220 [Terracidiphilus sp.]